MRGKGDSSAGSVCNFLASTRAATVSSSARCGEDWWSTEMLVLEGEQGSATSRAIDGSCWITPEAATQSPWPPRTESRTVARSSIRRGASAYRLQQPPAPIRFAVQSRERSFSFRLPSQPSPSSGAPGAGSAHSTFISPSRRCDRWSLESRSLGTNSWSLVEDRDRELHIRRVDRRRTQGSADAFSRQARRRRALGLRWFRQSAWWATRADSCAGSAGR